MKTATNQQHYFNWHFSRTTFQVGWQQKGKTGLDFNYAARDNKVAVYCHLLNEIFVQLSKKVNTDYHW